MVNEEKYTPVQNMYKSYLSFIDEENDFNDELEDMDNAFNEIIVSEKERFKHFFLAGMFAKDKVNKAGFDFEKYFNDYYYRQFPDE